MYFKVKNRKIMFSLKIKHQLSKLSLKFWKRFLNVMDENVKIENYTYNYYLKNY